MQGSLLLPLLLAACGILHAKQGPAKKTAKARKAAPSKPSSPPLYVRRSTEPIIVVWPPEGMELAGAEGEFIFGSVSQPKARFKINDQPVDVRPSGAYLAWLPVHPGTFTFNCSLELKDSTAAYQRSIFIPTAVSSPTEVDLDSLWPKTDVELRAGDWLLARLRAVPRQSAQFRLGDRPWLAMREASPGVYEGAYLVQAGDNQPPAPVEYRLDSGWNSYKTARSRGQAALNGATPLIAALRGAGKVVKTGPGSGYLLFPSSGTRFVTAGRLGSETKVSLGPDLAGWIDTKDLELLPPGTFPPRATANSINTRSGASSTTIGVSLTEKVPFQVEEAADLKSLTVRLFYTTGHTNWIIYDPADAFVSQVRWQQAPGEVVEVKVDLTQPLWGYQAFYENGSLKVELRRAPALAATGSPLKGRTIFLDPGHMPSATGATGPMGTKEMDANYAIAKAVSARLAKEGAFPVLSRDTTFQEVSLTDRPRLAVEKKADLFVSLHNNALPDGENPFARPRGYSVFYYHPHSFQLARDVHAAYQEKVPLPDEELRYGNLLVARLTAVPAILVESAYMIIPEQEEKLNDAGFRAKLADAVVSGLRQFLEKERAKQASRRAGRKP